MTLFLPIILTLFLYLRPIFRLKIISDWKIGLNWEHLDYNWHIFDWKTTDCDIRCDKMTAKMCIKESDTIDDNTINNNDKNFKTSEFKLCPSKTNGFHCVSKTICKDRNEFCALTLLDLSHSELNSIPIEINDLKK